MPGQVCIKSTCRPILAHLGPSPDMSLFNRIRIEDVSRHLEIAGQDGRENLIQSRTDSGVAGVFLAQLEQAQRQS